MIRHPSYALLWARLLSHVDGRDASLVQRAYHLAHYAHGGQVRDGSQQPYITHPLRVGLILAEEVKATDPSLLCTALLHDVLEDSDTPLSAIEGACGVEVAAAVALLTKGASKEGNTEEYFCAIAAGTAMARLVKCADRLDNLRSMRDLGDAKRLARYVEETVRYILPIAEHTDPYLFNALRDLCIKE